jgi:hypothetical protein
MASRKVAPVNGTLPPPTTATTVTTITVAPSSKVSVQPQPSPTHATSVGGGATSVLAVASTPEKLTPALIDPLILKFKKNPDLEAEFQQSYAAKYFDSSRKVFSLSLSSFCCVEHASPSKQYD